MFIVKFPDIFQDETKKRPLPGRRAGDAISGGVQLNSILDYLID